MDQNRSQDCEFRMESFKAEAEYAGRYSVNGIRIPTKPQ